MEFPFIRHESWAAKNIQGQDREWAPTRVPRTVTASANVNPLDDVLLVSGNSTLTLETAVAHDGIQHTFFKTDAANTMTLACTGAETLNGAATLTRTAQYDCVIVKSNGTNWIIVAAFSMAPIFSTITDSALTSGRVVCAGTAGLLQDFSTLTYDGTTYAFTGTNALFGTATAQVMGGGVTPQVQVHGTTAATARMGLARWSNDASAVNLFLAKSRNAAIGSHTVVSNNDSLASIIGLGSDGTGFISAASIQVQVDGTPGTNDMPGRLVFFTTPDGSTTLTEAMRLDSAQNATFAGTVTGTNLSAWTSWTPTRTGWVDVGSPTVTARYCRVRNVAYLQVKIVPGTTTATTAGTSYIDLPIAANASAMGGDGTMVNDTTFISVGNVVFDIANSRCYLPTQGATGNTLSISAWWEV